MLPRPLHALLDGLAIRQKGIRDFFNTETTEYLKCQTNLTFRGVDRIAHRKNHRQLAVCYDSIVDLKVIARKNDISPCPSSSVNLSNLLMTQMIFRLISRYRVKPGGRVIRHSMQCPMLRRLQECIACYVFRNFNVLQTKMTAQDGRHSSIFLPEQMG